MKNESERGVLLALNSSTSSDGMCEAILGGGITTVEKSLSLLSLNLNQLQSSEPSEPIMAYGLSSR